MNNKYIYDTNINQEKQLNKNNPNSNTNFNINNQRFSSDFLISPFKEEQSPSNNIPKNSNKLIQQNIESKILTKSDLKDSNNINKIKKKKKKIKK